MNDAVRALHQTIRGKERQHDVRRPLSDPEVRANLLLARRMPVEPGEEVEMDDRRRQQVYRIESVAIAIDRERVGDRRDGEIGHGV